MKRRSERELMAIIDDSLMRATDYATTALQEVRKNAWDYYLARRRGDEVLGRSSVVDTTIRDHHAALMSTIMPSYATDHIVQFEPTGPDDEDAAEAESSAINNIFTEDNSGYNELSNAISDALLFRNGVIKVGVDSSKEQAVQRFNPQANEGAVVAFLEGEGWDVDHIERAEDELTVTVSRETQKLMVKAIEPAYFFTDPNQGTQRLWELEHPCHERVIFTRGELVDMGIARNKVKQLDELTDPGITNRASGTDVQAKFIEGQGSFTQNSVWADQRVECFWSEMRVDGESWRFLSSNSTLLLKDPINSGSYASGAAWPVPHRWSGLCLYDLLGSTQDNKTNALRQLNDNLNLANNSRPICDPNMTNMDSVINGAPGRAILSKDPANVGWMPTTDVTSQSLAYLSYLDDYAGRQAGRALDMATAEGQAIQGNVSGISAELQLGPQEQLASQVSRSLSESLVRGTFLLIHKALREDWKGTIQYRKTDEWVEVDPSEWQPRNRLNITVGLSPGDRRRHRAALQEVIQTQLGFIQGGAANIAVTYKGVHNAIQDWLKASELDGAEGYFLDPDGQESQQGQQAAAEQAQEESELQKQLTAMQVQLEQQKQELDKYKHDTELQFKYYDANLDAEVEEAKIVESGTQARLAQTSGGSAGNGTGGGSGSGDQG